MESNLHSQVSYPGSHPVHHYGVGNKTLSARSGTAGVTPAAGGNPELVRWYEEAYAYYNAVMSGAEARPAPDRWQDFLNQMQWSAGQLGYGQSSWDPMSGDFQRQDSAGMQQQAPAGAKIGPMGNVVFNSEKAETTYSASALPTDVLSDEFTLDVDVKVKDVTVEKTKDTRLQPAMDVIKIIVKDPYSVPSETVYFVQEDAKIKINTIGGKGVSQKGTEALKLPDGSAQIIVGTFQAGNMSGSAGGTAESSLPGVEDSKTSGVFTYKPEFEGEKIDFFSQPGKNQTHHVWSNANISTKPGDNADASLESNGDMIVKVTHDDGSMDTYVIKKGYSASVNINKEYITFRSKAPVDGKIPQEFGDRLKIPSLGGQGGTAATQNPDRVDTGKGAEADAKVQTFINAFVNPKVNFDDIKKAGLIDEIAYNKGKPSQALLKFILAHDTDLQYQQAQRNGKGRIERMKHFLTALGYTVNTTLPTGYDKTGVIPDLLIVINGKPYHLVSEGWGNPDPINLNEYTRTE